jgi:hypothetical protein
MVTHGNQDTRPKRSPQGSEGPTPEPDKINSSRRPDLPSSLPEPYHTLVDAYRVAALTGLNKLIIAFRAQAAIAWDFCRCSPENAAI